MRESMIENNRCPKCNSERFITEPNQYDVISFEDGNFNVIRSESTDDEYKVFCENCYEEIDFNGSLDNGKIIPKTNEQ